jgi:hypothetical protein
MIGRAGTAVGVLAMVALAVTGCGSGDDAARTQTTSPAAFVDAVSALVQPAERMGVVATSVLEGGVDQPQQVEVVGLTDDVARQITRFGALRLGDPALAATQKRLLAAMGPIATSMRQVRAGIEAPGHTGLQVATTTLLNELKALPSAG